MSATIASLRESLCSETTPLPIRFRALFSLKHLAVQNKGTADSLSAIDAIAAAFASPSALLKHELAYCLGQTGSDAAIPHLTQVLEDLQEDPMCRHEAAEALGALGKAESLGVLQKYLHREGEDVSVKETCEIAIDRIEWENSEERKQEKLRQRYIHVDPSRIFLFWHSFHWCANRRNYFFLVTLPRLIPPLPCPKTTRSKRSRRSRRNS